MPTDIFKGLFFLFFYNQRKISLWKDVNSGNELQIREDPMMKQLFFSRRNAELLLKVNKTRSKVETASVPSSSKKAAFWFHAFIIIPASQIISINQSSISCQTVTACNFKVCKSGKFRVNTIHI